MHVAPAQHPSTSRSTAAPKRNSPRLTPTTPKRIRLCVCSPPVTASRRFLAAFTAELVAAELPHLPAERREATVEWVLVRVDGAGQVTRAGLTLAAMFLDAAVRASERRPLAALPDERRRRAARRLATTSLPPAAEYARAVATACLPDPTA